MRGVKRRTASARPKGGRVKIQARRAFTFTATRLAPPDGAAHGTLHRTPLEGAQLPALRTPPALSFYVLRVEYLVWAGSPDR